MLEIELSNCQKIYNLNNEQKEKIRKDLTFKNPAYENILKYSKWGKTREPEFLHYYKETAKYMEVPVGYSRKHLIPYTITKDDRLDLNVSYPKPLITLRDLQEKAVLSYMKDVVGTLGSTGTIILPTGSGKSLTGVYLSCLMKQRTLIVVNKDDLVDGWTQDIKLCFGEDVEVGLVKGRVFKIGEQFTLTTIQTLSRLGKEKLDKLYENISMIICDECLKGDTLVTLADGGVKYIKDIVDGEALLGGKVHNSFNRKARLFELQTQCGVLRGSYTHPTWCIKKKTDGSCSGYKKEDFIQKSLGELDSSYYVPILVEAPHIEKVALSDIEARFVAMIMCDGHLERSRNRVKVNIKKDVAYYEEIFSVFSKHIKVPFKKSIDVRGNTTLWFNDKNIKYLLESKWGVPCGKKSNSLIIPEFLYYAPKSAIKAFIETCLNCEGDLSIEKNSERLSFNSTSEKFVLGLKHLLSKFGIVTSFQSIKRKNPKHSDITRFSILPMFNKKFVEQFKLLDRKMPKLLNGMKYKSRFVDEYYLCPIRQVVDLGVEDVVYDFEVKGSHSFIANGILTHNCHHVGARSYNVLSSFPAKYRLGLTATKMRNDGLVDVLDLLCGETVFDGTRELTEDIIPAHKVSIIRREGSLRWQPRKSYYNILTKQNVHNIKNGDLELYEGTKEWREYCSELESQGLIQAYPLRLHEAYSLIAEDKAFNLQVAKDIKREYDNGKSCVVFCKTVEQLKKLYEILLPSCPKIQLFYGGSANKAVVKEKAESKEVLITLATVSIACEGTNVKSWERGFLVSSVANEKDLIQILGRLRRTKQGKDSVIFYDYTFPNMAGIRNHWFKRKNWYKDLGCTIRE